MLPERFRHIAVEGPIGAGKTSLARKLASLLAAKLLLENADENPFLARFYEDRRRNALPAQLFFLLARVEQIRQLGQCERGSPITIADYLLEKDPLFAKLNLDDAEYRLYLKLYHDLKPPLSAPDLVIYLQASPATLMERVRRRDRGYERGMNEAYLADLARSYSEFFYHYDAAPLMIVNSEHLNPADREDDFQLLLQRIREMRGTREFFNIGT